MKDAFGGIFNLALIAVFLVTAMGILGLTVNYTKAFRAKNIIISTIEEYGGGYTCFHNDGACFKRIKEQTDRIAYHPHSLSCPPSKYGDWYVAPLESSTGSDNGLFCYDITLSGGTLEDDDINDYWFTVVTQVDMDIPIINKIMGLYFFQVKGDTRRIKNTSHQKINSFKYK